MSQANQQSIKQSKTKSFYSVHPWTVTHYDSYSEVSAYVEASGKIENVLTIRPTSGASAEIMAGFVLNLINDHQRNHHLLRDAMDALELVLEDTKLNFTSEQTAEKVVSRIKNRMT